MSVLPAATESNASTPLREAEEWLRGWKRGTRFAIGHSGAVDGVASAALVLKYLERCGHTSVMVAAPDKGTALDDHAVAEKLGRANPQALILLDGAFAAIPGTPALFVDDDVCRLHVDTIGDASVGKADLQTPSTSLTVYRLLNPVVDLGDVLWYASLGLIAARGTSVSFPEHSAAKKRWGQKNLLETVALLSAALRASAHDAASALAALTHAETPADIANGMIAEYDILDEYRTELQLEKARCAKLSPQFVDEWAIVRFSSSCEIEQALAGSWVGRLPKHIVLAANDGYMPGLVYFTARTRRSNTELSDILRASAGFQISLSTDISAPDGISGFARRADFDRFMAQITASKP